MALDTIPFIARNDKCYYMQDTTLTGFFFKEHNPMITKWINAVFVLMTCAALVTGCSSEKQVSKENFKKAIVEWNQQNGGYMLGTNTIPLSLPAVNTPKMYVRNFAKLSFAGMVTIVLEPTSRGKGNSSAQQHYNYSLTELGKKYYTPDKGFKVATPGEVEVEEFIERTDSTKGGVKTYLVKYKYTSTPTDLGKIIYKDDVKELSNGIGVLQLDLTDSGWKAHTLGK